MVTPERLTAARTSDRATLRPFRVAFRGVGKLPEDCARARGHLDVVTLLEHRKEWAAALS